MNDKYLVTGATGFVGANIVRRLVKDDKDVHILVRDKGLNWRLSDISKKVRAYEIDLLDKKLPALVAEIKPDYIFHLAAYGSLPHEKEMDKLIDINFRGTINLIDAAKTIDFKLFINTGSSSEYGAKFGKMKETDLPYPINDYGVVKTAATLYAYKEAVRNDLPIITFRLFSAYGPYEHKPRFIPSVIRAAIQNKPIKVGNKKYVRDFTYIDDIVSSYLYACNASIKPGEIYNIGVGKQRTLEEVVNLIIALSNSKSNVEWGAIPTQERQMEMGMWEADTEKTEKELKWKVRFSLEEGLKETIGWFRQNINLYE